LHGDQLDTLTDNQVKDLQAAGALYREALSKNSAGLEALKLKQLQSIRLHSNHMVELRQTAQKLKAEARAKGTLSEEPPDLATKKKEIAEINEQDLAIDDELRKLTLNLLNEKIIIELNFMRVIEQILTLEQKSKLHLGENPGVVARLKNSLLGYDNLGYDVIMNKMSRISALPVVKPRRVFVITFKGNMMASQVKLLRDEISAVLSFADVSQDEVIVQLDSGGGTVTGYGLGAAQLQRIKTAGLPLTVVVDEVGSYFTLG
jgi:hypothetical protein